MVQAQICIQRGYELLEFNGEKIQLEFYKIDEVQKQRDKWFRLRYAYTYIYPMTASQTCISILTQCFS